jgi:hypothetical protein
MRYRIMARKPNGEIFECFVWNRHQYSGVVKAYSEAKDFGIEIDLAWAEPIEEEPEEGK